MKKHGRNNNNTSSTEEPKSTSYFKGGIMFGRMDFLKILFQILFLVLLFSIFFISFVLSRLFVKFFNHFLAFFSLSLPIQKSSYYELFSTEQNGRRLIFIDGFNVHRIFLFIRPVLFQPFKHPLCHCFINSDSYNTHSCLLLLLSPFISSSHSKIFKLYSHFNSISFKIEKPENKQISTIKTIQV